MCVAILKHLEAQILEHTQEQSLLVFLKVQCRPLSVLLSFNMGISRENFREG